MSYTSLYGVPEKGSFETVAEYGNSWGSAPVIWDFIWDKYLRTRETERDYESAMNPSSNLKKICDMDNDGKLLEFETICMKLTFDHVIINKCNFSQVADALDIMYLASYNGTCVNHLKAIANDLRNKNWDEYVGCAFRHTSVGDDWTVYEEEESRLYDISRDSGHWFLTFGGEV